MVEIRLARPDERYEALSVVLNQPGLPPEDLAAHIRTLLSFGEGRNGFAQEQWVAVEGGEIALAVGCLDSPGRTTLLFLPSTALNAHERELLVALVGRATAAANQRGMRLIQSLIAPESAAERYVLASAGFELMAELIYMERLTTLPPPRVPVSDALTWVCYGTDTRVLFEEVVQATYKHSLDCPRLSGLRDIGDVIAGHRATGEFDPQDWFVFRQHGRSIGCLLLAKTPQRQAMELVYMGVVPEARGRHFGAVMLAHALQHAKRKGIAYMTLAVDCNNAPARRLYGQFGFTETIRRAAWVLTHQRTA